jgi:hypothetical protein
MLEEPTPTDADPTGDWYCFERGASKASGGEGWADVWKRGYFGWEYKGKRKDLDAALAQLKLYALGLENPPLLIVCDMERFRIVTNPRPCPRRDKTALDQMGAIGSRKAAPRTHTTGSHGARCCGFQAAPARASTTASPALRRAARAASSRAACFSMAGRVVK